MLEESLDAYILQETWLDGTNFLEINGFCVFTHRLEKQTCNRDQLGVAIILAPSLYKGSPSPIVLKDLNHPEFGRFIGVQFAVNIEQKYNGAFKKKRRLAQKISQHILIASAYSPVEHQ